MHIHFARSKNPQCSKEWRKIKVMIVQAMSLLVEQVEWDPVLLHNISSQVEHMHMIYIVYPCIYHVYTWYV
jgi:hypothetical protein